MGDDMKEFFIGLLNSLEHIEVKGKNNLDILLGCMMAIENAIKQLDEAEKTEEDNG